MVTAGFGVLSRARNRLSDAPAPGALRALLATLLIAPAVVPLANIAHADSSSQYPITSIGGGERYFSPDGDQQEDTLPVSYVLGEASDVGWTITDQSGQVVKSVAAQHLSSGFQEIVLDGGSDSGALADGRYTLNLTAHGASLDGGAVVNFGVTHGVVAHLTDPTIGAVVSGDASAATLALGSGLPAGSKVTSISMQATTADGDYSSVFGSLSTTTLTGTFNTLLGTDGANLLSASVGWQDPLNGFHNYTTPGISVTIDNPVRVTSLPPDHYVAVGENGESNGIYYNLSRAADVTMTVTDGDGDAVAVPLDGVARAAGFHNDDTWDYKTTTGDAAPNGVYTVTVDAVDSASRRSSGSFKLGLWRGGIGAIATSPIATPLSGDLTTTYTPALPDGSAVSYVQFSADSTDGKHHLFMPAVFQSPWSKTISTAPTWNSGCCGFSGGAPDGDYDVTGQVDWIDPLNYTHYTTTAPGTVSIANDVQAQSTTANDSYLTPKLDGSMRTWFGSFAVSESADVSVVVKDADAKVIDTLDVTHGDAGFNSIQWTPADTVADGVYTIETTATDTDTKHTSTTSNRIGVDTRSAGTVTAPDPYLAGGTMTFTPADGVNVNFVTFYLDGKYAGSGAHQEDGTWTGAVDASSVPASGDHTLVAEAAVSEPFGGFFSSFLYSDPVTISAHTSGKVTSLTVSPQWFSPTLSSTQFVSYSLDSPGTVTVDLLDADDNVTANLAAGISAPGGFNSFSWDGTDADGNDVPSGGYTLRVTSVGADSTETSMTKPITLDRRLPGELTMPTANAVFAGSAGYEFVPTQGYGVSAVQFCIRSTTTNQFACKAANQPDGDGVFRASQSLTSMAQGNYLVSAQVKSVDPYSQQHTWFSPDVPVQVKALVLPLNVTATPTSGPAPLDTTVSFKTSHPDGISLTYTVDFGDGSATQTGTVDTPYPIVDVAHSYQDRGNYNATVTVTDGAGHTTTKNSSISVTNRPPTGSISVTPLKVVVGSAVTASLVGADPDNDPLTYGVTWGDGTNTGSQSLVGGAGTVTHTYTIPGTYTVGYILSDGFVQGGVHAGSATVVVQSDQPPVANPGSPPAHALATVPVLFDGSASTPTDGITSYHWDFGDGSTANQASASHTYTDEGAYTATLTVKVGDRADTDSIPVAVGPKPKGEGLKVTVTGGGGTLANARVVYTDADGSQQTAYTAGDGVATIHGLPDGQYSIAAWKDPYRPGQASADVSDDNGHVTIDLINGDLGAVTLDAHEMSLEEIKAAGIDPDDPANQFVFSFNIRLAFSVQPNEPPQQQDFQGFANSDGFTGETQYTGAQQTCRGNNCPLDLGGGYQATPQPDMSDPKHPKIVWLVMPVDGTMLKQFFDVQMVVTNLVPGFTMSAGVASLQLDSGLSLAPISDPQSLTMTACADGQTTNCMPDIPGGASQRVRWVVRGDKEGDHQVSASYDGSIEPVDAPVHLMSKPVSLKVWGATGLQFTVHVQDQAYENLPYDVSIEVKNITPETTFYNVGLTLQSGQHYTFAPAQEPDQQTPELRPDQTWIAEWQVVPDITGQLDLSQSVVERVSGGDATKPDKVVTDPAKNTPESTPQLHAVAQSADLVALDWSSIKNAAEYRIYATDDLGNGFISDPLSKLTGTNVVVPRHTSAVQGRALSSALLLHPLRKTSMHATPAALTPNDAAGSTLHYAVMTVTDGKAALRHNIADVLDGFECPSADQAAPSVKIGPWALTGCIKHISGPGITTDGDDDVWVARQKARINGLDLAPTTATGEISFNLTKQTLSSSVPVRASLALPDVAGVSVPPIKLFEIKPAWDLSASDIPLTLSTPKMLGLPVSAQATFSATTDGEADVNATVTPPAILGGKPSAAKFHADNAGGLHLDALDVNVSNPGLGSLIGLDTAHMKFDGSQWNLNATGPGGTTADGSLKFKDDGSLDTGHLVVHKASIGGLFTIDNLTLDATAGEHWTGTAQATLADGSNVSVSFDLTYTNGKLSAATVTAPKVLLKGLLEVNAAKFTWTSATSTWTIAGTVSAAGSDPTTISGKLVVPDGTIAQGELHITSLRLGGLGTLSQLDLSYNSKDSSWSGNAAFAMPGTTNPALHLSVTVVNGVLTQAHADVGQATLAGLLTTKNAAFDYVSDPGTWQLTADEASLGNLVAVKDLKLLNEVGKSTWQVSGKVDAAGSTATIDAQLTYDKGELSTGTFDMADVSLGGLIDIEAAHLSWDKATSTWAAAAQAGSATMDFTVVNGTLQSGHVSVPSAKVAGVIDITDFKVDYDGKTGAWGGGGTAALPGKDSGKLTVSFAYADGALVGGSVTGSASFLNALAVNDVSLSYDKTADRWSGGAKITLPGPNKTQVGGNLVFEHGKFVSGTATVANVPLATGIDLREFDLSIDTQPVLKLSGHARVATSKIPGLKTDAVSVDGNLTYTFSDPGQWHADGTFNLVDFPLANAHFDYLTSGKATFGGNLDVGLSGIANVHADLNGTISGDGFSATGGGSVTVLRLAEAAGHVLVDNHGIAGCGEIKLGWTWEAGVVYPWGGPARAIGATCDLSSWEAANASAPPPPDQSSANENTLQDSRDGGAFTPQVHVRSAVRAVVAAVAAADAQVPSAVSVPSNLPVFALSFTGDTAPSVTLTDPDGNSYPAVDGVHDGPGNGYAVTRDDTTTYFMLNEPNGGDWAVSVDEGSPAVTNVQQAQGLPQPDVTASVTGSGDDRTLDWSLKQIPGQTVTFVEDGGSTSHTLVTTSDADGSAPFTPAAGPGGTRTIRALVSQDGFPRTEFAELATFDVADTTPIALSVSTDGTGMGTVTSSPAGVDCGATCAWLFASGHSVTLTAKPNAASDFVGWGGACAGTKLTCELTPTDSVNITASFAPKSDAPGGGGGSGGGGGTPSPTPTPTSSASLIGTVITIATDHPMLTVGDGATLSGGLTQATTGKAMANRSVVIWRRVASGDWKPLATTTTDSRGRWSYGLSPRWNASYTVAFAGTSTEAAAVARAVDVKARSLVLWAGKTDITTTHRHVGLHGRAAPNHAGDTAILYVVDENGSLQRLKTVTIGPDSHFVVQVVVRRHSERSFVIGMPGDKRNLPGASVALTLTRG